MYRYKVEVIFKIGRSLARLEQLYSTKQFVDQPFESHAIARDALKALQDRCEEVGLVVSQGLFEQLSKKIAEKTEVGMHGFANDLSHISDTIAIEMQGVTFMHVPADRASYYGKLQAFGVEVDTKFPSSKYDIWEAGNCYAAGRFTASVFHLMRVLEIGLATLGKVFNVSLAHTNWHPAIEEIEKKIRQMGADPNKPADWKTQQEFYSQAASNFMFLKDAWRNYTAHARGKYTEEEAEQIFRSVKSFMRKLSERLIE